METGIIGILSTRLNLKKFLILLSIAAFSLPGSSQDLLKLKSGKELKVIIVEENETSVKYREFENQAGPVYTVNKGSVESVVYKKGSKETQGNKAVEQVKPVQENSTRENAENKLTVSRRNLLLGGEVLSARALRLLLEDQPEALKTFNHAKAMYTLSNACPVIVMAITFPAAQVIQKKTEQADKLRIGIPVLCVDGVLIIAGILSAKSGKANLNKSAALYNATVNKPAGYTLNFGIQGNGIGMIVRF